VFTKSASRNFDSKECSKQEAGTIPSKMTCRIREG
jgi:hypothetical protein